jgi:hypothetical protein
LVSRVFHGLYCTSNATLDQIEEARQSTMSNCFTALHKIQDEYIRGVQRCNKHEDCDTLVLGGVLKAFNDEGILPFPTQPFNGLSFEGLSIKFGQMKLRTLCQLNPRYGGYESSYWRDQVRTGCGGRRELDSIITSMAEGLQGLELD